MPTQPESANGSGRIELGVLDRDVPDMALLLLAMTLPVLLMWVALRLF